MCECILRAALSWASFNPPAKVRSKAGGGGMLPRGIGTSRAHMAILRTETKELEFGLQNSWGVRGCIPGEERDLQMYHILFIFFFLPLEAFAEFLRR